MRNMHTNNDSCGHDPRGMGRGRGAENISRGHGPGEGGPGMPPMEGRRGRGERRGYGPMGPMGPEDMMRGERRGRGPGRGRKGDVRNAVLALLAEQPNNGYGLITALAERTEGLWQPGAGSVYPALQMLEDEGLIQAVDADGKKVYELSEAGRTYVAEHSEQTTAPWERVVEPHKGFLDVRAEVGKLSMALRQVVMAGSPEQIERARFVLDTARKELYKILAED